MVLNTRELIQVWVDREWELSQEKTLQQFLNDRLEEVPNYIEKCRTVMDKDTAKTIAIEIADTSIEINSRFDFSLSDWKNQEELFKTVIEKMQKGIAHFSYEMVSSGKVREAFGTISNRTIPQIAGYRNIAISQALQVPQTYWDIELQDWRSFLPTHLITVI